MNAPLSQRIVAAPVIASPESAAAKLQGAFDGQTLASFNEMFARAAAWPRLSLALPLVAYLGGSLTRLANS